MLCSCATEKKARNGEDIKRIPEFLSLEKKNQIDIDASDKTNTNTKENSTSEIS